jgi:general secretion pathway protein D
MNQRNLRVFFACLAMILLLCAPMAAKNKADQYFKQGQAAQAKGDWDTALDLYMNALDLKPNDAEYMVAMRKARFECGEKHVKEGQKLRTEGKLEDAMRELQKALIADPASSIVLQEIKRTQQMLQQPVGSENRTMTPVEKSRRDTEKRIDSILEPPELHPVLHSVGPLKINNQPVKVLFETVGKVAGVNVLFDSQFTPSHNFNLDLSSAITPQRAFDYLAVMTHTFWKPISATAIFVTEDNPTKHRDYDDEVVKTFYVTNATSAQEFQEIATAVRTVADIRRVFTYNAQKAMIVRGNVDAVELAEKMIHDLDKPKSEVVVDMIVMQANSDRSKQLAASIVNSSGTPGLNVPVLFAPTNAVTNPTTVTTTASGASGATGVVGITTGATGSTGTVGALVSLNNLKGAFSTSQFATSLPGAMLNLMVTDTKTKVLSSPTLRMSDGMKAEMKIGQRIPYATGSFQPGVGTVGVSPLVSTQFNYVDTGVNVTIQPQVHSDTELTLHVEVDVSSVAEYVNLGGLSQPVIGQNKNTADIRLREGEVTILGGLSQLSDSKTVNGIPGLVDIPVLGNVIFGGLSTDKSKSELLIALIPHIVRTPGYTDENYRGIYVGNDATVKLMRAPEPEPPPPPPEGPKPEGTKPQVPQPGAPSGATGAAGLVPPVAPASPTPAPPGAAPPGVQGQTRILFSPPTIQASTGGLIQVTIHLENVQDLFSAAPLKIKYDPAQLRLNDIGPGEIMTRDGTRPTSVKDIRNDNGEATLTVSRTPGSPGISGSGSLAVLNFVAIGKGTSKVTVVDSTFKNSQGQPIGVALGEASVRVQ